MKIALQSKNEGYRKFAELSDLDQATGYRFLKITSIWQGAKDAEAEHILFA